MPCWLSPTDSHRKRTEPRPGYSSYRSQRRTEGNQNQSSVPSGPPVTWEGGGRRHRRVTRPGARAPYVYGTQNAGVAPRPVTPKKVQYQVSNGSCGVFLNVETNCPVTGSSLLHRRSHNGCPPSGLRNDVHSHQRQTGAVCAAKYAAPSNGSGNSGAS